MNDLKDYLSNNPLFVNLILAVASIALLWGVIDLLKKPILTIIKNKKVRFYTDKIMNFFGYCATIFIIAYIFTHKVTGMDMFLAAVGGGSAIALKDVILSVTGWMMLHLNRTYKLGDRIELGGIKGDVLDIGVFRTTLMEIGQWVHGFHYSGRVVTVTNDNILKNPVFNYSKGTKFIWDEIDIDVTNDSDIALAQSILENIITSHTVEATQEASENWDKMSYQFYAKNVNTDPHVGIRIMHNYFTFRMRYSVDYMKKDVSKSGIHRDIIEQFKATNGKVKLLPYMTMKIEESPRPN